MNKYQETYKEELQKIIDEQADNEPLSEYDYIVFEMMAHSRTQALLKKDGQEVNQ